MKILITGGKGFIGRSLAERLGDDCNISAPGRQELNLLDAEKTAAFIKTGRFDSVIHCATYDAAPKTSTKDPAKVLEYNLRMFFNIARCSGDFGRMVYFGSGAEFGRENWKPRMAEDYFDEHVPSDQYGLSKYLMTRYAMRADNIYNLRLFGVFGKYDDWRYRFLPNICARLALGLPLVVGQNRAMDLLYIDDLVRITDWLLKAPSPRKAYNACTGQAREYLSVAADALRLAGKTGEISVLRPGLGAGYGGDNALLLGDSKLALTPPDDAIRQLYGWYLEHRESLDERQILDYPL